MELKDVLSEIHQEVAPLLGQGKVATYIPALANVDPMQFGMAITLNNGQQFGVGSYQTAFSIQSISKVFTYTLALRAYQDGLYKRVWREPSGNPFNSLVQLEYEAGIPRNPFINAGAIVVCDSLVSHFSSETKAFDKILSFIHECSGDSNITVDEVVAQSEMEHGYRNLALAGLMKSFGNFDNGIIEVLKTYFKHCSIVMNAQQLSRSMLYLANDGTDPISKKQLINSTQAKRINSLLLTCGHYDASGDFAFRVGLPGKSGVGGGIVAVVPGVMAIAVYSPALNESGNSLVGTKALELFTTKTGYSIF
ncbi:glutaminase [Colwellia piezophila]|uniref:glutaminase n=1 Tax=Colwellia piezophila TaxID=211668 RepID=UPI00037C4AA8|nr:glutaminase [Colwellia piezophila]